MRDRATGNGQIRSTKSNLYVTDPIAISDEMTSTVDEDRAVNIILLYFSKTLMVCHSFFPAKMRRYRVDLETVYKDNEAILIFISQAAELLSHADSSAELLVRYRQESLELLDIFQKVKMENGRFSSDVNKLICLKLICIDLQQRMGKKPVKEALKDTAVNDRGTQCPRRVYQATVKHLLPKETLNDQ
ncbi:hypothetical protein WISP_81848 [Willisornis vidua]|uniref:Uncharacterized protein n=1 Tax=Willisornis vidua TaxID=1566151 RepID=A0ABQ9DA95_9PASS|nr:hypothetical protein WISP_81848 [Willisornis vidua]